MEPSYASSPVRYPLADLGINSKRTRHSFDDSNSADDATVVPSLAKKAHLDMTKQIVPRASRPIVSAQQFLAECKDLELTLPDTIAAIAIKEDGKNQIDRLIQEIGKWLNARLYMRKFMTDSQRPNHDVRQLAGESLRNLKNIAIESKSKYAHRAFTLLEKFSPSAGCLVDFLPLYDQGKQLSTKGPQFNIFVFSLPWRGGREKSTSAMLLKDKLPKNSYELLARFINQAKAPLALFNLTDEEITGIAPHLRYLDCKGLIINNEQIHQLVNCAPNLTTLVISDNFEITTLPEMPHLTKLDCHNCTSLKNLPNLPLLTWLDCSSCHLIEDLPDMPLLTRLDCSSCRRIEDLPDMPLLTWLYCSSCSFTILPDLPQLRWLNCGSCRSLEALPDLPKITDLYCSFCIELEELPNMPLLQLIECCGCPSLKEPLNLPPGVQIRC